MDGLTLAAAPAKPRTPERPGKERRGQGQGDGTGRGDSWARCRVAHLAPPLERGSCRELSPSPTLSRRLHSAGGHKSEFLAGPEEESSSPGARGGREGQGPPLPCVLRSHMD